MPNIIESDEAVDSSKKPDELVKTLIDYFRDDRLEMAADRTEIIVRLGSRSLYRLFGLMLDGSKLPVKILLTLKPIPAGTRLHLVFKSDQGFYLGRISSVDPAYRQRFAEILADLRTVL